MSESSHPGLWSRRIRGFKSFLNLITLIENLLDPVLGTDYTKE
jgi:hypothetical protein